MTTKAWYPKRPFKVSGPSGIPIRTFGNITSAYGIAFQMALEGPIGTHVIISWFNTPIILLDRIKGFKVIAGILEARVN